MKHLRVIIFVLLLLFFITSCKDSPQIKFETNGGISISSMDLSDIKDIDLPTPEKVGYTFDGWFFDVDFTQPFELENLGDKTITVYAKWMINTLSISFDVHGGENLDDVQLEYDELLNLPTPEKSGYTFDGWYLEETYTNLFEEERMIDEDLTLHAKWVATNYTVSFVTNSDDVINDMTFTINDDLDDVIPEKEGLNFLGWYLDEALTLPFDIEEIDGLSFTLYAKWQMSYEEMYAKIMQSDNYTIKLSSEGEMAGEYIFEIDSSMISSELFMYKDYIYYDEVSDKIYQLIPSESQIGCYEQSEIPLEINFEDLLEIYKVYRNLLPATFNMDYVVNDGILFVPNAYLEMLNETVFYDELGVNVDMFGLSFTDDQLTYTIVAESLDMALTVTFSHINETEVELPETICENNTYVQGVTADRIYIGNTVSTSGTFAPVGIPYLDGMNAYINYINSQGGINGRYLELINYDDEFDATQGLFYTKKLIEENEVFAMVGQWGLSTIKATIEYLNETGIPTVYLGSTLYGINDELNDNIFPVQPTRSEGVQLVRRIQSENIYGSNFDQPFGIDGHIGVIYDPLFQDVVSEIHLEANQHSIDVTSVQITPELSVIQAAVNTLIDEGVDIVIILSSYQSKYVIQTMQSDNLHVPVFLNYQAATVSNIDISINYSFPIYGHYYLDISSEEGLADFEFYQSVMENYGDVNYIGNPFAIAGYQAIYMFVQGLLNVGDQELTWHSYINAMESGPINIPMGGFVEYTEGTRTGTNAFGLYKYNPSTHQFDIYRDFEQL